MDAIARKEGARAYPLDRLNDMRALINYAPFLVAQHLPNLGGFLAMASEPRRMSAGRLLRLHQAFLIAVAIDARLSGQPSTQLAEAARSFGQVLVRRLRNYPSSEAVSGNHQPQAGYQKIQPLIQSIGRKAGELADRLGWGEHVLYAHCPVIRNGRVATVTRSLFYQRSCGDFPHRLVLGVTLQPDGTYQHDVPVYRSRATSPIPMDERIGDGLLLDDVPVADPDQLISLNANLSDVLARVFEHQEQLRGCTDLDLYKMTVYSAELRDVLAEQGRDWNMPDNAAGAIVERRVSRALGIPDADPYAPAFFALTQQGLEHLQLAGPL
ncbi:hypothetical protein [Micromonospora zamorensis]|uniref:hypothetical protein n=1 Tax=Micromonospora zamorensis TaxID=709883 RepID=UPI0033F81FC0